VYVLRKYCAIAHVKCQIAEERRWLDQDKDGLTSSEVDNIKNILWESKIAETVLAAGQKSVDVSSFATW
jgi:hypothetical protein